MLCSFEIRGFACELDCEDKNQVKKSIIASALLNRAGLLDAAKAELAKRCSRVRTAKSQLQGATQTDGKPNDSFYTILVLDHRSIAGEICVRHQLRIVRPAQSI